MEWQSIGRLAVFKQRNIGDVLMMTPALRALRETFPSARITVVVNAGTEAMLAGNPHIDEVLAFDRERAKMGGLLGTARYEMHFLRELRRRRFDLTISFTEGDRAAWLSLLSGAPLRVGSAHYTWSARDPRRNIYNRLAPPPPRGLHEVERHFWVMEQAGIPLRTRRPGPLCLEVDDELRAWAREELAPLRPARVIQVHAVSRWLWKCWDDSSMAAVIDWLELERGVRVVLTTGPVAREREKAQAILALCRSQPRFYDGTLRLGQTAALAAESDGYFGIDTAPMHMAAAVGVPVVALFGPTNAQSWRPWSDRAEVLTTPCPCQKGVRHACDWSRVRACLAAVTPGDARAALERALTPVVVAP